jgi:multidrug resistance efflux pump
MSDDYDVVIARLNARAARAEARLAALERQLNEQLAQLERRAAAVEAESEQPRPMIDLPPRPRFLKLLC